MSQPSMARSPREQKWLYSLGARNGINLSPCHSQSIMGVFELMYAEDVMQLAGFICHKEACVSLQLPWLEDVG